MLEALAVVQALPLAQRPLLTPGDAPQLRLAMEPMETGAEVA